MLEDIAKDYAAYLKLDLNGGFSSVQDVIDNMLTRLEELTSVLQMVKQKNSECSSIVLDDIIKYRGEITVLSKKISTLNEVIITLHSNMDLLENQVEKAEADFGIHNDNKIISLFKPFLKKQKIIPPSNNVIPPEKLELRSVMHNFENSSM